MSGPDARRVPSRRRHRLRRRPRGRRRWLFPVGINVGAGLHDNGAPTGAVFGGEASAALVAVAWKVPTFWRGGYVDGLYDFGTKRARFSIGPEAGFAFLGIDGGFVVQTGDGAVRPGFAVRPLLTFGIVSAYARFVDIPGDPVVDQTWELGALVKWPIGLPPQAIH